MNFRFIGAMVSGFRFFKKKMANLMFICISDHDIFILFLHTVTFSHVLHLDVHGIETESEN